MTSSIDRTYHPKYVTYYGDGFGRDGYVVFTNGGLEQTRTYKGASKPSFDTGTCLAAPHREAPHKEASPVDYIPDGSGRDTYIIRAYGFKRNYKSYNNDYVHSLRSPTATPQMDRRCQQRRDLAASAN